MKKFAKHVALALLWSGLYLFLLSKLATAEFIYNIEGVFAPTLTQPVSESFIGELTFPEDNVAQLTGWVELTSELVPREFTAGMTFNLPNYRLYSGQWGEQEMNMILLDYGYEAGNQFAASQLDGGGLWDAWAVSFADTQMGSVTSMQMVNEPAGWALLAIGGVIFLGIIRNYQGAG